MDNNIRQIALDYQEANGTGLPFNGTDEEMIDALKKSFIDKQKETAKRCEKLFLVNKFLKEMAALSAKQPQQEAKNHE